MNTADSNQIVQSATNTTNIYNTIVHLGFKVCGSGESGKESNLEYEDDHSNNEGTLSSLFDTKSNLTEWHLESPSLTTKQEMEHATIAVIFLCHSRVSKQEYFLW